MPYRPGFSVIVSLSVGLLGFMGPPTAHALVIIDPTSPSFGTGSPASENTSSPEDFPYWDNVIGAGIYVGDNRYIRARHTGAVAGYTELADPSDGSGNSDIYVTTTGSLQALPTVPIITSPVAQDEAVLMIGDGRRRNARTYWDIDFATGPDNDTWSVQDDPSLYGGTEADGFTVTGSGKRWGQNRAASDDAVVISFSGTETMTFATAFDGPGDEGVMMWEAQGSADDSGGVAFVFRDGQWQLAGIIHAIGGIDTTDPDPTFANIENGGFNAYLRYENPGPVDGGSVEGTFRSTTFISDLSYYNQELGELGFTLAIPEPTTFALLTGACGLLLPRRRRNA